MPETMFRLKAGIFQALSHPTRVAILEALRTGALSVGQLCEKLGLEQANASQHLTVLKSKQVVQTRKEGNLIFYSVRDPLLLKVLDSMREFILAQIHDGLQLLHEEQRSEHDRKAQHEAASFEVEL